MNEWQPIETAPKGKDGFIAGYIHDGEIEGVEWLNSSTNSKGHRLCLNSHNYNSFPATHWMPLPPAPDKRILNE